MIKDSILFKIFVRFLKEKNMFSAYKSIVNKEHILNIITKNMKYFSGNFILQIFDAKRNTILRDKEFYITDFLRKIGNNIEFDLILTHLFKDEGKKFLEKKGILYKFSLEMFLHEKRCSESLKHINLDNLKFHTDEIINWHLSNLIKDKQSIFNFILRAFYWGDTEDGMAFWDNIHELFVKEMWEKILTRY